jgi:hypothetical protein
VRPHSRLFIVEGTGKYEEATGLLRAHGRVNLGTLEGSLAFKGKVCLD